MNRSRQLNASRFSQRDALDDAGSERSVSQSMLLMQQRQSGISGIIRVFSLLVLIIALLIGYKVYLSQQPVDQKEWIQREIQELTSQRDGKKDSFWQWQLFSGNAQCL